MLSLAISRSGCVEALPSFRPIERVLAGGHPAALARVSAWCRPALYRDYLETIARRDVRDLRRLRVVAGDRSVTGAVRYDEAVFVTSANLIEAVLERNREPVRGHRIRAQGAGTLFIDM